MPLIYAVGDAIIDNYVEGAADHIAPDAPIPVFVERRQFIRHGGLWNVANNLIAAGADVRVFSVVGDDEETRTLRNSHFEGRDKSIIDSARKTQRKTRFLGQYGQQVLRVDIPKDGPITTSQADEIVERMKAEGVPDAILVSDYGCGVVTVQLMSKIRKAFPTTLLIADPYPTTVPGILQGVDYLKLNAHEYDVLEAYPGYLTSLCGVLVLTRGPDPVIVSGGPHGFETPVPARDLVDACGAGDAFVAYFVHALASRASIKDAVVVATHAGACAVVRRGCYTVPRSEVEASMRADHVETL